MKKKLLLLFLLYFFFGYSQTQNIAQDATILKKSNTFKMRALWFQKMPQYNQDSSEYYFKKATKLLEQKPSHFDYELAQIYFYRSENKTINQSMKTLDSIAELGWKYLKNKTTTTAYNKIEYIYLCNWSGIKLEIGQTKEALQLFSKALLISENFKSPELKAQVLLDKGIFYERYKLTDERKIAYQCLIESKNYFEKRDTKTYALKLNSNYSALIGYFDYRNKDSVQFYSSKIKSILKYIKIPQKHAWYYVTTGRDLLTFPSDGQKTISQKQYAQGKANILKALAILEKYHIKKNTIIPYAHGLLADIYTTEKKYDLAIESYKKSQNGYALLNNRAGMIDMENFIAKTYELKGELKKALAHQKSYYEKAFDYESEKNERSLRESDLKISVLSQKKMIAKKQNEQLISIIVLGIVLVLLGFLFWNFKQKQNSNRQLAILNTDLESKNDLLDKKNAENELLLREIHHRVKNNLEVVSSLLALQSAQINDPNTKDAMAESQNRVNSIGIVHQKLYQGTNLGAVEMKDYFLNLSESILDSFGAEERVDLQLAMDNLDLDIDTAVPLGLIINELLTNTIKYAFPKGKKGTITIKLEKQANNMLHLEVADNGVGKSGITHGTGFGGQLVSLLTNQLNGTMREENQNGTAIIFDFKLKKSA
ncbi:MAG: sensor histidine kinase [Flavobacterium sp.]|uniref:sensor histidine kinase n=1 Tax=Flavobacterium sp. TaxID=239 RepID=UPI003263CEFB